MILFDLRDLEGSGKMVCRPRLFPRLLSFAFCYDLGHWLKVKL